MGPAMTLTMGLKIKTPHGLFPKETAKLLCEDLKGWSMTGIADLPPACQALENPMELAIALEAQGITLQWETTDPNDPIDGQSMENQSMENQSMENQSTESWPNNLPNYLWPDSPTILALIPHWQCEPWLRRCLASMEQQSHPLTHIVVIDDASLEPPIEIVRAFKTVTLLTASERVGPYGLIQTVIDRTDYDAYLFQDADDWSSCDRLETLLATARSHGAELVGSQEIRLLEPELQLQAVGYPLQVNRALAQAPGHPLLHPTSLVSRSLVQRIGGFATGLPFGGDTEFLLRAHWRARIVNSPRYCYFRRKRPGSLTTATATGLDSPARQALTASLKQRARANSLAAASNAPIDLSPMLLTAPPALSHCCGPELRWREP
jgi:hypothetical protein